MIWDFFDPPVLNLNYSMFFFCKQVEITCMGEPVIPTLQLHSLVDLWLETTSKHQRVAASIGSSAKEFVMVLVYSRKLPECNN